MTAKSLTRFLTVGAWLPMDDLRAEAKAEAKLLTQRADVPSGPNVPEDLRDVEPRFFRLPHGFRLAGRMLVEDAQQGFLSAAQPLLFAVLPLLTVIAVLAQQLLGGYGLVLPVLALAATVVAISNAAGTWPAIAAAVFGVLLPLFGSDTSGLLSSLQGSGVLFAWMFPFVSLLALAAVVIANQRLRLVAKLGVALLVMQLVVSLLPPAFTQLFWLALACAITPIYSWYVVRQRYLEMEYQGNMNLLESGGPQVDSHIQAREQQAKAAATSRGYFILLGIALGVFTKKFDGFSPDKGLIFGFTSDDMDTHLLVLGSTGSGKTSAVLRPHVLKHVREGRGGLLLLDGKGSLPGEFLGLRDYLLIEPGRCQLALIEGLTPEEVVIAFDQVNSVEGNGGESGSARYFRVAGREMLHHTTTVLFAISNQQKVKLGADNPARSWRWTVADIVAMLRFVQQNTDDLRAKMANILAEIEAAAVPDEVRNTLADSIDYVRVGIPSMDKDTRANIHSTVNGWVSPLMHSELLAPWANCETGVDPTKCLRGGLVGVCLPKITYGAGGVQVQAFVKQRVYGGLRRRGVEKNWRADPQATDVLIAVDEAQEMSGSADQDILPVARSLGGQCLFATQNIENFIVRLGGEHAAHAFLDNFQSFVCFKSSPRTMKWVQERLGTTWSLVFSHKALGIDYRWDWRARAESPLADPTHPAAAFFRKRLRLGAGRAHDDRGFGSAGKAFDASDMRQSMLTPSRGGEWKMQPLFLDAEADFLAEKFVAVAEVMRGGVRRRDIIKTNPMRSIPEDMLDVPEKREPATAPQASPMEPAEVQEHSGGVKSKPTAAEDRPRVEDDLEPAIKP